MIKYLSILSGLAILFSISGVSQISAYENVCGGDKSACPHKNAKVKSYEKEGTATEKIAFTIKGMDCLGCESQLILNFLKIDAVKSATADFKAGTAKVVLRSAADNKILLAVVAKSGYKGSVKSRVNVVKT